MVVPKGSCPFLLRCLCILLFMGTSVPPGTAQWFSLGSDEKTTTNPLTPTQHPTEEREGRCLWGLA